MTSHAPRTAVAASPVESVVAEIIDGTTVTTEDLTEEGVVVTTATRRTAKVRVQSGDSWTDVEALTYAMSRVRWYNRHRKLSRAGAIMHDMLLLLTGAATTLTAALHADAWVTAVLAATSFVLAGMTKVFRWRENATSRALAWSQLSTAVNRFRFLPPERRDAAATERLVTMVDGIIGAETRNSAQVAHSQDQEDD